MQTSVVDLFSPRIENPGGVNSPSNPTPVTRVTVEKDRIELPIFERSVLQKDKVSLSDGAQNVTSESVDSGRDSSTNSDLKSDKERSPEESGVERRLTDEQEKELVALQARDAEVKAHERAHKAVGGQYAGAISYEYQQGPNGKRYAVGGEVSIDVSPVSGNPEKTIEKMNVIKAAALAPAEPSPQDRRVAAQAAQTIASARAELNSAEEQVDSESSAEEQNSDLRINQRGLESYNAVSDLNSDAQTPAQKLLDDLA